MLPRRNPTHRPRLESGIELRDVRVDVEDDEPLTPEEAERRRAYAEWLSRFESGQSAA